MWADICGTALHILHALQMKANAWRGTCPRTSTADLIKQMIGVDAYLKRSQERLDILPAMLGASVDTSCSLTCTWLGKQRPGLHV